MLFRLETYAKIRSLIGLSDSKNSKKCDDYFSSGLMSIILVISYHFPIISYHHLRESYKKRCLRWEM